MRYLFNETRRHAIQAVNLCHDAVSIASRRVTTIPEFTTRHAQTSPSLNSPRLIAINDNAIVEDDDYFDASPGLISPFNTTPSATAPAICHRQLLILATVSGATISVLLTISPRH
jgi:hypothetical protein